MSEGESAPKCNACNIVFSQRKNLLRHNRSFHEERKFDIKVLTKSDKAHATEIDTTDAIPNQVLKKVSFACPICCGKSFPNRQALKFHLLKTVETVKCPECTQHFETIKELAIHLEEPCKKTRLSCQVIASVALNSESYSAKDLSPALEPQIMDSENEKEVNDTVDFILPDDEGELENTVSLESNTAEPQEWEEDSNEAHYCTSCNIHISSVADHVEKFHPHQTIYYETGEVADGDESELVEFEGEQDETEDQEHYEEEYLEDEEADLDTSVQTGAVQTTVSQSKNYLNTNILRDKLSQSPSKEKFSTSTPAKLKAVAEPSCSTTRLPKIIGTLGRTNEVDARSGVKYVRKVVKIEKFWEDDSFQLPQLQNHGDEEEEEKPVKRKRLPARKTFNLQVNKKMLKVKSHLERLVTSASEGKKNPGLKKKVIKSEDTGESNSQDDTFDPDKEAREAIIKILQDDSSEEMSLIYVCQKCGLEFSSMNCVKTHKCKLRKSPIKLTCEVCGLKCKSQRRLVTHVSTHDPFYKEKLLMKRLEKKVTTEPIICSVCNTQFTTEVGYRMHMKMHRPDNIQKVAEMNNKVEYRCDLCQMTCYSERTLRIHYKVHFPYGEPTEEELRSRVALVRSEHQSVLACKLCLMTFEDNATLKEHWQTHTAEDSTVDEESITGDVAVEETVISIQMDNQQAEDEFFSCEDCGKILSESYREMHEKMHRGELFYVCGTCNRKFPCQEHLDLHERIHEAKVELKCGQCSMKFSDQALLAAHVSKHSAIERPYPCGFCGKCFSRPHEKVKHERVHTGEQPYECNICGMRFRVAYCLRMHERIHTGVRPYGCEFCEKTFRTRSGYKQHVSIHSDLRQYHCKMCPKSFKTIVQLAGHRKSHTKPYICTDCNRRFATSYMLRSHMANHANEQTSTLKYKCPDCGASYGREYALRDHLKSTHNKVMPYPHKRKAAQAEFEVSSNDSSQEAVYLAIE